MKTQAEEGEDLNTKPQVRGAGIRRHHGGRLASRAALVSDLLTKPLKHAFVGQEGRHVDVQLWTDDVAVHLEVRDTGNGLPPGCAGPREGISTHGSCATCAGG